MVALELRPEEAAARGGRSTAAQNEMVGFLSSNALAGQLWAKPISCSSGLGMRILDRHRPTPTSGSWNSGQELDAVGGQH